MLQLSLDENVHSFWFASVLNNGMEITWKVDWEIATCKMNNEFAIYSLNIFSVLIPNEVHRCPNGSVDFMNGKEYLIQNEPIYGFTNYQQQKVFVHLNFVSILEEETCKI